MSIRRILTVLLLVLLCLATAPAHGVTVIKAAPQVGGARLSMHVLSTRTRTHTHTRSAKKKSTKRTSKKKKKRSSSSKSGQPTPVPTAKPASTDQGTDYLNGTMSSTYTLTMTGGVSVGHMKNLDFSLPVPQTFQRDGLTETVTSATFTFNEPPDSTSDSTDQFGNTIRDFHWNSPTDNTPITVTETLQLTMTATMTPFQSTAAYPLTSVPSDISTLYLSPNQRPPLQLPVSAQSVLDSIKGSNTTERDVVQAAANWVAQNTSYSDQLAAGPFSATTIFNGHQAACRGYDNLLGGILEALGIPTRAEYGWISAEPLTLPYANGGTKSITWSTGQGELHTWLEIWFPDRGWVPFDPQYEKYFVDTRHIGLFTVPDAGRPANESDDTSETANAYDQVFTIEADSPATVGSSLVSGQNVSSILPGGSTGTQVKLQIADNMNLSFRSLTPDVKNLVMFSR